MDFADLVRRPELEISVIAATPDALSRPVTGAYITDLPDPSRFLTSGDVVLTSGLWKDRSGGSQKFISALARQRVAGLIVGLIDLGHVPDDVIALCREHGLTLATTSDKVSFKTIGETIANGQPDSTSGLVARGVRFNRHLAEVLARGEGAVAALRLFHEEFSLDSWVIDDVGSVVALVGAAPSKTHTARIWNEMLRRRGERERVHRVLDLGDRVSSVWALGSSDGHPAVGYFVCWGDYRSLSSEITIVIDALLGALRVELELSSRWRDAGQSRVAELVQALIDDSVSHGEVSARMRLEGLDPQLPTAIVVAEVRDPDFPVVAVLDMTQRMFSAHSGRVIGGVVGDHAVLLVNGPDASIESYDDAALRTTEDYLAVLAGRQLRVGISDAVAGLSQLGSGIELARQRLLTLDGNEPVLWSNSSSVRDHRGLLATMGERKRAAFALEVLRPLIDYDTKHGADFLETLRVFLESNGGWQEASRQLQVHANTLRYRIARIEELTGRSLGSIGDRVDLYLALSCLGA
jgi:hypothetical protein